MRIALVLPGFSQNPDDWAIPALLNFARTMAQRHELHVFSQRYPAQGTYQFDGLIHQALGGGQNFGLASLWIWWRTSRAIIAQHRRTPFDLLHAFWADEAGFAATLAAARIKRPLLVSLGGGELTNLPAINYGAQRFLIRRLTTRYALRRATFVTAGSGYQLDLCRAHRVPASRLRLAPLGVDTGRFRPRAQTVMASGPPTIFQAASLLPVKNQVLLLEILALIKKKIPNIKLKLAGTGPCQVELTQLAQTLDLSHNMEWQQQVLYPDMPALYQQSDLYLQTSRHESQGMAVLEALACGLPVLGTPVGVMRDLACRSPSYSKEVLAAQAIDILSDQSGYRELSRQARQIVENQYNLSVTMNNFQKIYQEAVGER